MLHLFYRGSEYTYSNNIPSKYKRISPPHRQILLKHPGKALGRHLQFFVLSPFDIDDDRPTRGADPDAPRSERDAICGQVEPQRSEVGTEEVFEKRAGLHQVEQVPEGLGLTEMELGFVCADVIVHLECDEQITRR